MKGSQCAFFPGNSFWCPFFGEMVIWQRDLLERLGCFFRSKNPRSDWNHPPRFWWKLYKFFRFSLNRHGKIVYLKHVLFGSNFYFQQASYYRAFKQNHREQVFRTWIFIGLWAAFNSHCFPVLGVGHQPNSRCVFPQYEDFLLKLGWPFPI